MNNNVYIYNKVKRLALMILLLVACTVTAVAQQVVTGTVVDADLKEPIIGANVVLVNSQNRNIKGTTTDIDGNYSLSVPENLKNVTIQVSYIGMKTQKVKYTGQTKLDFT